MRKVLSILFLLLLLLQAIPVLHFFSSNKEVFYAYIDEEKPEEKSKPELKITKEYLSAATGLLVEDEVCRRFSPFAVSPLSSPVLDFLSPPPDAC